MTRAARTSAPKRTPRKAPAAAKASAPLTATQKAKARAQLPANPVARRAVAQDLAEWEGRVKAARTPIAREHSQGVLDKKRRAYGRPARGRGR